METKRKFNKNIPAYIFAAVLIGAVVIIFFVYGPFSKNNGKFHMTKQEFATLADSGDDHELLESAREWAENFCPVSTKKVSKVSQPVKNVDAMLHLHYEVLEGGFPQFYFNGYNTYGFDYGGAFKAANLDNIADLYLRAQECFEQIEHTMPSGSGIEDYLKWCENNPLAEYDDEYADRQDDIVETIAEYIRTNISYFGD